MRTAFPEETPPGAVARHHPLLFHSGFRRLGSHQATPKSHGISFVSLTVKPVGKPDARNGHVRFDERGWETGRRAIVSTRVHPRLYHERDGPRILTHSAAAATLSKEAMMKY